MKKEEVQDYNPKNSIQVNERDKKLKREMEKDREMVKGFFKYYEVPGGNVPFVYRKYKGEKIQKYDLYDGQIYTLPLGVAKHLNRSGWYPVHAYTQDANGNTHQMIGKKVRRYGFQSLEFIDLEDLTETGVNDIITVKQLA